VSSEKILRFNLPIFCDSKIVKHGKKSDFMIKEILIIEEKYKISQQNRRFTQFLKLEIVESQEEPH
jgi:hypothetical protein